MGSYCSADDWGAARPPCPLNRGARAGAWARCALRAAELRAQPCQNVQEEEEAAAALVSNRRKESENAQGGQRGHMGVLAQRRRLDRLSLDAYLPLAHGHHS